MINLITTVGISIFENYLQGKVQDSLIKMERRGRLPDEIVTYKFDEYDDYKKQLSGSIYDNPKKQVAKTIIKEGYKTYITRISGLFLKGFQRKYTIIDNKIDSDYWEKTDWNIDNNQASAEIQSIIAIMETFPSETFKLHLLATDTILSQMAAEVIKNRFEKAIRFEEVSVETVQGLQINEIQRFKEVGFDNLVKAVNNRHKNNEKTIINISGGYKAITPLLTILAQLKKVDIAYLHEESQQIVILPPLPINFDWQKTALYHYYLKSKNFEQIKRAGEKDILQELKAMNLLKSDESGRTELGKLFFDYRLQMPDTENIFGFIVEQKVFIDLVQKNKGKVVPETNLIYYLDILDGSVTEESRKKTDPVEIDFFYQKEEKYILGECKAFDKLGVFKEDKNPPSEKDDLSDRLRKGIYVLEKRKNIRIDQVRLIVYTYHFQNIASIRKQDFFKRLAQKINKPLLVDAIEIPIKMKKASINYMNFIKSTELKYTPYHF